MWLGLRRIFVHINFGAPGGQQLYLACLKSAPFWTQWDLKLGDKSKSRVQKFNDCNIFSLCTSYSRELKKEKIDSYVPIETTNLKTSQNDSIIKNFL